MLCGAEYSSEDIEEAVMNRAEIFLSERVRGMSMGATIVGGFAGAG